MLGCTRRTPHDRNHDVPHRMYQRFVGRNVTTGADSRDFLRFIRRQTVHTECYSSSCGTYVAVPAVFLSKHLPGFVGRNVTTGADSRDFLRIIRQQQTVHTECYSYSCDTYVAVPAVFLSKHLPGTYRSRSIRILFARLS